MSNDGEADAANHINSPDRGFLGNLAAAPTVSPVAMPQYAWRGRGQFLKDTASAFALNQLHEDDRDRHFLVTGVSEAIYNREFRDHGEDRSDPFGRWCAYDRALELLLFRMVETSVHSVVAPEFYVIVHDALRPMRLTEELAKTAGAGNEAPGGAKQPDAGWRPVRVPYSRNKGWPSVVLEVANSEFLKKLQSDVRFWLRESEGHVKTVLTIAIRDHAKTIVVEKWEKAPSGRAHSQQHIEITRNRRANTATVTGGPLVIDFEKLFSRPISSPIERDIVLGDAQLSKIARVIWQEADKEEEKRRGR